MLHTRGEGTKQVFPTLCRLEAVVVLSTAAEENSSLLPDGLMLQLSLINPIGKRKRRMLKERKDGKRRRGRKLGRDNLGKGI